MAKSNTVLNPPASSVQPSGNLLLWRDVVFKNVWWVWDFLALVFPRVNKEYLFKNLQKQDQYSVQAKVPSFYKSPKESILFWS